MSLAADGNLRARQAAPAEGLYTGAEFLESLRDGREVWIYGERVKDVTVHPAFRNSARMLARVYDALHDPAQRDLMTIPMEGNPSARTHRFFQAPRSIEEQVAGRDAIAQWARITYGWMGRTPDYKAGFLATLGANNSFYGQFKENAKRWYDITRTRVPFVNHAIIHPPVDRDRPVHESADVCVHVDRETDSGLVVSGAKVVATGSVLTHYTFVAHLGTIPVQDKKFAVVFMVPTGAPGVKLVCRGSYEYTSAVMGSPFDYPLSSRLDENDAIFILDQVKIPWEDVFIYDVEGANDFLPKTGFLERACLQGATRLAVKLDFISGLLLKAVEITGTKDYRGVQANVGQVISLRNLMWALSNSMAYSAVPWGDGYVLPNGNAALAYNVNAPDIYSTVRNLIEKTVASGLIYLNSHAGDFRQSELRPLLDRYLRGSNGADAVQRVKVMKLLWDCIGSEFGARHELYEINYAGSHEEVRRRPLLGAMVTGDAARFKAFADQCMAEYDLDGWTVPDLINPTDVNLWAKRNPAR